MSKALNDIVGRRFASHDYSHQFIPFRSKPQQWKAIHEFDNNSVSGLLKKLQFQLEQGEFDYLKPNEKLELCEEAEKFSKSLNDKFSAHVIRGFEKLEDA